MAFAKWTLCSHSSHRTAYLNVSNLLEVMGRIQIGKPGRDDQVTQYYLWGKRRDPLYKSLTCKADS